MRAEDFALSADAVRNQEARGWSVRQGGSWGQADGITVRYEGSDTQVDPSGLDRLENRVAGRVYLGGADTRGENAAIGY
jgi:hypothetical protein